MPEIDKRKSQEEKSSKLKTVGEFAAGMAGAHMFSNYVIDKALKTKTGRKALDKLLDPKKPMGEFKKGFIETVLGPEYLEIHKLKRGLSGRGFFSRAPKLTRGQVLKNTGKRALGSLAGVTLASIIPGGTHLVNYNLLKSMGNTLLHLSPKEKAYIAAQTVYKGSKQKGSLSNKLAPTLKGPVLGNLRRFGEKLPTGITRALDGRILENTLLSNTNSVKRKILVGLTKLLA